MDFLARAGCGPGAAERAGVPPSLEPALAFAPVPRAEARAGDFEVDAFLAAGAAFGAGSGDALAAGLGVGIGGGLGSPSHFGTSVSPSGTGFCAWCG